MRSKRARRDRVLAMRGLRLSRTSVPEAMFAAVSLLFVLCSTSSIAHFLFLPFLTGALQLRYLSLFPYFVLAGQILRRKLIGLRIFRTAGHGN